MFCNESEKFGTEETIFGSLLSCSDHDLSTLRTSIVEHILSDDCNFGQLLATLVSRSFPPKDTLNFHLKHDDFDKVQKIAQDFLQLLISDERLTANDVAKLLRVCVDSPWIAVDSLRRFFVFCFNILLTSVHDKDCLRATITNQDKLVLCKPTIIELMAPFPPENLKTLVDQILSPSRDINFTFALSFITTFYVCANECDKNWLKVQNVQSDLSELSPYAYHLILRCLSTINKSHNHSKIQSKNLIAKNIKASLEHDSEEKFVNLILIVRQLSFDFEITTRPFSDYKCWLKYYFGYESTTLADNTKKFSTLCKFLSNLVPYDNAHCLRAHVNEPPVAPLQYRRLWSDYHNLARTRLSDLGSHKDSKGASIFGQGMGSTEDQSFIDRDIYDSVTAFIKNGSKIPAKVSEASVFRRTYFDTKFIPRLVDENLKISGIDDSDVKRFIAELAVKGKIPKSLLKSGQQDLLKQNPLKRKHALTSKK